MSLSPSRVSSSDIFEKELGPRSGNAVEPSSVNTEPESVVEDICLGLCVCMGDAVVLERRDTESFDPFAFYV